MASAFDEFVKRKTGSANQFDADARLKNWHKKVSDLNSHVHKYLKNFIDVGTISVKPNEYTIHEELLGSYAIQSLDITIGKSLIRLKPVGTILLGGIGRVDMIGNGAPVMLVLAPKDANQPSVRIMVGNEIEDEVKPINWDDWVWKIAVREGGLRYIELNKDSFQDALMSVAD